MKREILIIAAIITIVSACHAGGIDKFIGKYKDESADTISIKVKSDSTLILSEYSGNQKQIFMSHFLVKGDTLFCSQLFQLENNKYTPVENGDIKVMYDISSGKYRMTYRGREEFLKKLK